MITHRNLYFALDLFWSTIWMCPQPVLPHAARLLSDCPAQVLAKSWGIALQTPWGAQRWVVDKGKSMFEWMMIFRGTPILGNPHMGFSEVIEDTIVKHCKNPWLSMVNRLMVIWGYPQSWESSTTGVS